MAKNKAIADKVEEIMRSKDVEKAIDAAADKAADMVADAVADAVTTALDEDVASPVEQEAMHQDAVADVQPIVQETETPKEGVVENEDEPKRKRILVDEQMWHHMVNCMVIGQPHNYLGIPGVMRFGEMRGAKNYDEAQKLWIETQEFLRG